MKLARLIAAQAKAAMDRARQMSPPDGFSDGTQWYVPSSPAPQGKLPKRLRNTAALQGVLSAAFGREAA